MDSRVEGYGSEQLVIFIIYLSTYYIRDDMGNLMHPGNDFWLLLDHGISVDQCGDKYGNG